MIEVITPDEYKRRIFRPRTRREEIRVESPTVQLDYANGLATIDAVTAEGHGFGWELISLNQPMSRDLAAAGALRAAAERGIRLVVADVG